MVCVNNESFTLSNSWSTTNGATLNVANDFTEDEFFRNGTSIHMDSYGYSSNKICLFNFITKTMNLLSIK